MEIWKNIKGYEGIYKVSQLGNVVRIYKTRVPRLLKPIKHSGGYRRLKLRNNGNDKDVYIHRLVAEAFLKHNKGDVVNHIDGDKTNNNVTNLEWVTQRENVSHGNRCKNKVGTHYSSTRKSWSARIMINGERKHLGEFKCETAAHTAYLKALKENNIINKYA